MAERKVLALDIGASKFGAGVVDEDGNVLSRGTTLTPQSNDADEVFEALTYVAAEVMGDHEVVGVGICSAAPMEPGGVTVSPLSIYAWRGFPLLSRAEAHFKTPVFIDGDAKALALAERWVGAAIGVDNFIAMVVSSGVGGGIILDGRLLDGRLSNAGHIGHVIVEPNGRRCPCGGFGCLEAEASGISIEAVTGKPAREASPDVIERTGTMVGRGVASVANLLDLDLALVGGSVALGFGEPFFAAAQAEIDRRCHMDFVKSVVIKPVGAGVDGPVIGAAAVGFRGLGD